MELETLVQRFPRLYHVADPAAWPGIERLGLLSTTAILDLFDTPPATRALIESARRPAAVRLQHPVHGTIVIRDNKPLLESRLAGCLQDGLQPVDWYRMLSGFVFFWPTYRRARTILDAAAYASDAKLVLRLVTEELASHQGDDIWLSPMNSGATRPFAFPRGRSTFLPVRDYDYEGWRRRRSAGNAIAEVTVRYAVPLAAQFVDLAEVHWPDGRVERLWGRAG